MRLLSTLLCLSVLACGGPPPDRGEVVVFAAASLQDALRDAGDGFERGGGARPFFNFAGSNTLARQIEAGARADLFVSADERWMDVVERAARIDPETRADLLSNALVLVARGDTRLSVASADDLTTAPFRALVLGDPESVPAGRYAKAALGPLWFTVEGRVVPTLDVRAALALVESDPEFLGIVYRTDAAASKRVRVLHEFAADGAHPIRYVAAVTRAAPNPEGAGAFLEFLRGPEGRAIFIRHGFEPVDESGP